MLREDAKKRADSVDAQFSEEFDNFRNLVQAVLGSDLNKRLRLLRDKVMAHSLEEARLEVKARQAGEVIGPVTYSDFDEALARSIPIVKSALLLLTYSNIDSDEVSDIWKEYGTDFWGLIGGRT